MKAIENLITEHLSPKQAQKEALGEVFTPPSMIHPLLDQFPPSIWKSKSTTFLDPAAGIGNFPLLVFFRCMDGLASEIPNATARAKHIIEKMIFMVEINSENTRTAKSIFHKLSPTATPNVLLKNFLTISDSSGLHEQGWPTHYTVVLGNPPYNAGGTKKEGEKRLHISFTDHGLKCLEPKGFLSYICPPNYREADSRMNKLFQDAKGHFRYIKIYGANETFALFRIQGRVDSFIFQLGGQGSTVIDDEYGMKETVTLDLNQHIPNFAHGIFEKLYKAVEKHGAVKGGRTTEMTTVKANSFGCGSNKILHLITESGLRVFRTKRRHSLTRTSKVFINGLGVPYVFYDAKGVYGPSQSPVVVQKPSASVVTLLTSPLFQCIAWGLRLTGNNNLPYLLDAVPNLSGHQSLDAIYSALHLTAKEKAFLEENFPVPAFTQKDKVEPCHTTRRKAKGRGKTQKKD